MNTAQKILRGLAHNYRITPNPLYCWEAWRISRESGETLPEFAAEYFDRCAAAFVTMENPETKKQDRAVAEATEFKTSGRGSRWTQAQRYGVWDGAGRPDRVRLFMEVQAEMALGRSLNDAAGTVADRLSVSESAAIAAYYEIKPHYPDPPTV